MHPIDAFGPPAAAITGALLLAGCAVAYLRDRRRRATTPDRVTYCSTIGCRRLATHDVDTFTRWSPRCETHAQWMPFDRVRER